MIWLSSCFLQKMKKKEILGPWWVHPILKYREDGEFPFLIKDQRDSLTEENFVGSV